MALERIIPGTTAWRKWGHQHLQRYLFTERFVLGKRVLDLACGAGYGSYVLRTLGAGSVVGVDLDGTAIDYARENYKRGELHYEQGNALLWEGNSRFDVVVSFETIEHLADPKRFINRLASHLEPNGILIISAPNTLQYLKANPPIQNEHHLNEPDHAKFRSWLENEFIVDSEWEQSPVVAASYQHICNNISFSDLLRQGWVRTANKLERALRHIVGKTLLPIQRPEPNINTVESFTDIMPLLPERTAVCDVFVFVCRRRQRGVGL